MDGGTSSGTARVNNKAPRSTMATETHRSESPFRHPPILDDHYDNEQPRQRRRREYVLPPLDVNRFVPRRRGFDYRRPSERAVSREARASVPQTIDLTRDGSIEEAPAAVPVEAQRLPRYGRDIIDVMNTDSASRSDLRPPAGRAESPLFVQDDEIEFVSSRPLSRVASRSRGASAMPGASIVDLTEENDDDVQITGEQPAATGINAQDPVLSANAGIRQEPHSLLNGLGGFADLLSSAPGRLFDRYRRYHGRNTSQEMFIRARGQHTGMHNRLADIPGPPPEIGLPSMLQQMLGGPMFAASHLPPDPVGRHRSNLTRMPGQMDFETAAFALGVGAPRTPEVQYEAPAAAEAGFTRNPKDDEEVVCPNCGAELAVEGDETQRQVWVIKQCGHAYCGSCVHARFESSKKSAKSNSKQRETDVPILKKCVIDGKAVNKSSTVHLFLGG